ncbi:uncharacterized protein LOC130621523 [Hydractinia symbiolongicarpus]|uniref:uncharacterized protein LOC130621523 n=1 Tax=Hydractinia symbiolongicarpus TaxID=13093 RepID=UPI00254FA399|nr:uncharacterized protein LOC130621523 [Hydractinia symbiolongicarpus]
MCENMLKICAVALVVILSLTNEKVDGTYSLNLQSWHCGLNYKTPRDYNLGHKFPFGFCFKDPSQFCFNHAVTMNGCKQYNNMGLYCCIMENVNEKYFHSRKYNRTEVHTWLTKDKFLSITSLFKRNIVMYKFLIMDIAIANIDTKEELAAFLSIVFLDTHFLTNMEEHLPADIAKNVTKHGENDDIKFIGRGAIHVKGRKFYQWISPKLNKLLRKEGKHNLTLINAVEAPEVLLFPTFAFRTAAYIWGESYSYVKGKPLGKLYKRLAVGSLENMVKILHHLKNDTKELPALLNIWQRVRKVLNCPGKIKTDEKRQGSYRCLYEQQCRSGILTEDDTFCNTGGYPEKKLCLEHTKDLLVVLLFYPDFPQNQHKSKVEAFVSNIFANYTRQSNIKVAFSIDGSCSISRAFSKPSKLYQFLRTMPNSLPIKLSTMINATVKTLKESRRRKNHHEKKYIIAIVSDKEKVFSDETLGQINNAEDENIHVYSLFAEHDKHFYRMDNNHTMSLQSRQLNLNRDDIIERLCNDPSFIPTDMPTLIRLKQREKHTYVIKVKDYLTKEGKKNVMIYIRNLKGKMTHQFGKMNWPLPFDNDVSYDGVHTVRKSLQMHDTYARFEGDPYTIKMKYSSENKIYAYKPDSYDVYILLEGVEADNLVELFLTKVEFDKVEIQKLPNPLKVSYMISICFLTMLVFTFVRHSLALVTRLIDGIRRMASQTDDASCHSKETKCKWCYRRLSDDKAYLMLYNRENGTVDTEYIRRNLFLTEPIRMEKTLDKCMVCLNGLDFVFVSSIHFLRIIMLIIMESIIFAGIYRVDMQTHCNVSSGFLTFFIQMVILLCTNEMLYYCGWREMAKNKKWWSTMTGFCIAFSITIESTRDTHKRSCWPLSNDIPGYVTLACVLMLTMVFFILSIYYIWNNDKRCSTITYYCLMLILLMIFLLAVILVQKESLENPHKFATVLSFSILNCFTMLLAFNFTLAVQAKAQNSCTSSKLTLASNEFLKSNIKTQQQQFDKALDEAADEEKCNRRSSFILTNKDQSKQSLKKLSILPSKPPSYTSHAPNEMNSISLPNYTIQSVLCSSNSSICNELENDICNDVEIIVRKRPRSASATVHDAKYLDAPNDMLQSKSAELYKRAKLQREASDNETYTFVTRTPPVIEIHHGSDAE